MRPLISSYQPPTSLKGVKEQTIAFHPFLKLFYFAKNTRKKKINSPCPIAFKGWPVFNEGIHKCTKMTVLGQWRRLSNAIIITKPEVPTLPDNLREQRQLKTLKIRFDLKTIHVKKESEVWLNIYLSRVQNTIEIDLSVPRQTKLIDKCFLLVETNLKLKCYSGTHFTVWLQ